MTELALTLALYVIVGGAVAIPFLLIGRKRFNEGRRTLGQVLVLWGFLVPIVPISATLLAYAFLPREPDWNGHESYPLWPFVFVLTAIATLGITFILLLGWMLGRGANPGPEVSPE